MGLFGSKTPPRTEGERPSQAPRSAAAGGRPGPCRAESAGRGEDSRDRTQHSHPGRAFGRRGPRRRRSRRGKDLRLQRGLRIGPQAQVNAEVKAHHVVIAGRVVGNVVAAEKVEILPSGILEGNIRAPKIAIAEGAQFKGSVDMGGKAPAEAAAVHTPGPPDKKDPKEHGKG
ncbi:MAG: polymer-forming cytoskeletal protein [Holophagales bacterium]|nr:polymer-forming cytoskeletal protein [Holophagales bacterium]